MCSMMNIKLKKKKQTTKFDIEFIMICNLREILNNCGTHFFIFSMSVLMQTQLQRHLNSVRKMVNCELGCEKKTIFFLCLVTSVEERKSSEYP